MATSSQPVMSVKNRTVVLTLPKGLNVSSEDFLPFLELVRGRIIAFGTVGVGYIWHLTLKSLPDVDRVIDRGNFYIGDFLVQVSRFSDMCNIGTLYWLPYWVPHDDVVSNISKLLGSRLSCQNIQIPQRGFEGCYSTKRRLESPVSLDKLPHFLQIESEGQVYRTFLLVPGRPPVCFHCGGSGHMKSSCENKSRNVPVAPDVVDPPNPFVDIVSDPSQSKALESQSPHPVTTSQVESEVPNLLDQNLDPKLVEEFIVTGSLPASEGTEMEESDSLASIPEKDEHSYKSRHTRKDGSLYLKKRNKQVVIVNPPTVSTVTDAAYERALTICMPEMCFLEARWEEETVSYARMKYHLDTVHPTIKLVKC